jgi:hemolysin D
MMTDSVTPTPAKRPVKPPAKRRSETEFLPAALEVIETPASPVGRAIMLTISAFLAGAILWASFGEIDIIATTEGRVIPSGKSKVIQPFETGVVRAIDVSDGQTVKAGDKLIELDPALEASDEARAHYALAQDALDVARLTALLADDHPASLTAPDGADADLVARAQSHMQAEAAEHQAKIDGIDRQIAEKQAESRELGATTARVESSLPLMTEQRDIRGALLQKSFGNKLAYLQAEQQLVEAQHELDADR